eukprot:6314941-Amphidinium_carterae.1
MSSFAGERLLTFHGRQDFLQAMHRRVDISELVPQIELAKHSHEGAGKAHAFCCFVLNLTGNESTPTIRLKQLQSFGRFPSLDTVSTSKGVKEK